MKIKATDTQIKLMIEIILGFYKLPEKMIGAIKMLKESLIMFSNLPH
jgi:hypothetical protein